MIEIEAHSVHIHGAAAHRSSDGPMAVPTAESAARIKKQGDTKFWKHASLGVVG